MIAHLKLRMHENPDLLVILCFDEAQLLTTRDDSGPLDRLTLFAQVRRALHIIRTLPVFALFLSTECKLEEFSTSPQMDSSARIVHDNLTPFAPIVWTPLDVLAQRITKDKVWTLREVASTYHMAHLGRPLSVCSFLPFALTDVGCEGSLRCTTGLDGSTICSCLRRSRCKS